MQWSRELHAGFSKSEPWLPLAEDADVVNVECERDDAHSMLTLYRRLIELRRGEPALEVGDIMPVDTDGDMLGFVRRTSANANDFLVLLNLSGSPHQFSWPTAGTIAVSTHLDRYGEEVNEVIVVRAHEGVVVRLGRSE